VIKLFSTDDPFLFQRVKSELDAHSIPYMVKNEFAGGALGEVPWQEAQPELWLVDDDWAARAMQIVNALEATDTQAQNRDWYCTSCNEENGSAFDSCWHCGEPHCQPV